MFGVITYERQLRYSVVLTVVFGLFFPSNSVNAWSHQDLVYNFTKLRFTLITKQ